MGGNDTKQLSQQVSRQRAESSRGGRSMGVGIREGRRWSSASEKTRG
jgi:hypothetical protein